MSVIRTRLVLHADPEGYDNATMASLHGFADELRVVEPADLIDALRDFPADDLFVGLGTNVDESVLRAVPGLRSVVTPTTSHNHLAERLLQQQSVTILSLRGRQDVLADITATAEHTWALILGQTRRLRQATRATSEGSWSRSEELLGYELRGPTLGVVGLGRVGLAVARVGAAFGMCVLYHDVVARPAAQEFGARRTPLSELMASSDVVCVHAALTPDSPRLVSRAMIGAMRPDALLVNTSQGELVDEEALADAVVEGRIYAAVDVLDGDSRWTSTPPGNRVLALPEVTNRVLVTPHIGGHSDRSVGLVRRRLTEQYIAWAKGQGE